MIRIFIFVFRIKNIIELRLMAPVDVCIVAFDSVEFNIMKILDEMSHTWDLNALQNPAE